MDLTIKYLCATKKLCIYMFSLMVCCQAANCLESLVNISPSRVAQVCTGGKLELICTVNGTTLVWNMITTDDHGVSMNVEEEWYIASFAQTEQTQHFTLNSDTFTVKRSSSQNSVPLVSTLTFNDGINTSNNMTQFMCTALLSLDEGARPASTTTIHIIGVELTDSTDSVSLNPNVTTNATQFGAKDISIVLEWISENGVSYDVIVEENITATFIDRSTVQLTVLYNTDYNVSVIATQCGHRNNSTTTLTLHYTKCGYPVSADSWTINLDVLGFHDPALEGTNIYFNCFHGLTLIGPNISTCTGNGQWVPDPRIVECSNVLTKLVPQSPTTIHYGHSIPCTSVIEGTNMTFVCQSDCLTERDCPINLITAICTSNGVWEPSPIGFCSGRTIKSGNNVHVVTIVVVTLISVVAAFFLGFFCGHIVRYRFKVTRQRDSNSERSSHNPIPVNETVQQSVGYQLKENEAYGSLNANNITFKSNC